MDRYPHFIVQMPPIAGVTAMKCPECEGSGEIVVRPARLMGATYIDGENGDEKLVPCPHCQEEIDNG